MVGVNRISLVGVACAITLNYCTYTNHVGVSPRALYYVVDTSYGLGRSLGDCRPALRKGRKYQMVKTQTESHVRRPVLWTNQWQIWVFFSFEVPWGTARICHPGLLGFSEALYQWVSLFMSNPMFRTFSFVYKKFLLAQGSVLNSMHISRMVDILVTHANQELGLTPLFGNCLGFMPPQFKTKTNRA